ncbi:MAG: helix-turn-helix domain-containing protein [Tannerellaceae bacterium]|nr:helix-turn-helix domain-containing protein [Tannerellaceae bacterium]
MDQKKFNKHRSYLSQRLIEAREKKGLTQKNLHDMGVIDQSNLSKIEGGKRKIDVMLLIELAEIYEQPIDFFFIKPKQKKTQSGNESFVE